MRIGTYNMISQIYGNSYTKKSNNSNGTSRASFKDEVNFSSLGKDMQVAKNALAGVPDTRADLVNDIKSRMDNGTYEVDSNDFADKLLSAFSARNV
ncbi:MAG: flagellar biosynthesis anti-sigma factor FlgM [Wujia sp.]